MTINIKIKDTVALVSAVVLLLGSLMVFGGCKSGGTSQPTNPFATDRQTAPPPATFSPQASYLGQSPGAVYVPQAPATPYSPSGGAVPLPSGPVPATMVPQTTVPMSGTGSIGSSGATLFQSSSHSIKSSVDHGWSPSGTVAPVASAGGGEIATVVSSGNASMDMATQMNSATTVRADGSTFVSYADPNALAVSSSQMITLIDEDPMRTPPSALVEPKSMYASQYQ